MKLSRPVGRCALVGLTTLSLVGAKAGLAWAENRGLPAAKYVRSVNDFKVVTELHITRVHLLGVVLFRTFRDSFSPNLDEKTVSDYLSTHDHSKLDRAEVTARLFSFYGQQISTLPDKEKRKALRVRNLINSRDDQYQQKFLVKKKFVDHNGPLDENLLLSLKRIETLADLVDRGLARSSAEEFGVAKMKKASEFVLFGADEPMVQFLEANYEMITAGFQAEPLTEDCSTLLE
jgi:hypothetical protein